MIGFAKLVSILLLNVALATAAESIDETKRQEALRLTEQSLAQYRAGEDLETDWSEAYDRGIALAEKAISLDPQNPNAHYALFLNLGRRSQRSGLAAQAKNIGRLKDLLQKTLDLDPAHAHAWEARGEMLMQLPWFMGGSEQAGEEALGRSAKLDPRWSKPPLRLAQFHWKRGQVERARVEAAEAARLARQAGDGRSLKEAEDLLKEIAASAKPR